MNETTKRFVTAKFGEYYKRAKVEIPTDLWMREWGFVLFDHYYPAKLVMRRHKAFAAEKELVNYLLENAPAHAYHSAAIYKYPTAKMADKGWLGADLIFDLDADHVIGEAEFQSYSYEAILKCVKEETLKLIDFLLNDFGFPENKIELVFSGSRGYHIHIETEEVRGFGSRERREIVDYVMATGLDINSFLVADSKDKSGKKSGREDLRLIPEGWGKRVLKGLIAFLHEIEAMDEKQAIKEVKSVGAMERKKAKEILRIANDETVMSRIEKGQIPHFSDSIWQGLSKSSEAKYSAYADKPDAPVTADIKRLIRLPTSLHGKSSLQVKPLSIETFDDFDPLVDAVAFGDSLIEISVTRNSSITMKGESYEMEEGEVASVPEHVALYFMCRGVAEIK
uniref:DNA primase small subunit PriS n=1 Tax=Candidatus Methanophaga sp. ANME-1 ERB7 TaxID=2759913 RepID=A0A7G9ZAQ2_9EURY|nr:DNA primase small subunit PriS [Methanosarcinales archaeon ANME-1 ERB7]